MGCSAEWDNPKTLHSNSPLRPSPLRAGIGYLVVRDYGHSGPCALFRKGQVIELVGDVGYSPHDEASVYECRDLETNERLELWWFDSDDSSTIQDAFAELDVATD